MNPIVEICEKYNIIVKQISPLSGGDINEVFKITSSCNLNYVIKLNQAELYPNMFHIEAKSLKILSKTESFIIPKVCYYGDYKDKTYLVLEYIPSINTNPFSENFALALAKLHRKQSSKFGLDFNNYIGSLEQVNTPNYNNSLEFYINLRLLPQLKLAKNKGFNFKNIPQFLKNLDAIIPLEKASLIHGDLWSGNFLITSNNKPCIYDPAIAFASREMDIAMMKLFGGYPNKVFNVYNEVFPMCENWTSRIELWQLYYILVHVNLFGSSYHKQAQKIINKYA